ncbi:MAG TPA: NlpC/P60 family protein, partial [Nakamurella sp.]
MGPRTPSGTRVGSVNPDGDTGGNPSTILGSTIAAGGTTANSGTTAPTQSDSSGIPNFVGTVSNAPTLGPFNDSFAANSSSSGGVQDVAASCPTAGTAQTVASDPADPVLPAGTYANVHLTDAQAQAAQLIISVGKGLKITDRGIRIALAVALQESSLQPWVVSGPYAGLFQQLPDAASGLYLDYDRYDATGATHMFYEQLVKVVPAYQTDPRPDWQIGEAVQQTGQGQLFEGRLPVAQALTSDFFAKVPAYDFDPAPIAPAVCTGNGTSTAGNSSIGLGGFNPGDIISDAVFYDSTAMNAAQVRTFIAVQGARCNGGWCLKNITVTTQDQPADGYCDAYQGAPGEDAATVITKVALACHINPQVMLVTLQKESALLTRTDVSGSTYAAAWGWHCPDSGPGGTASCDPKYAGFFAQAYGMAKQWARYKVDPGKYHYRAGQTAEVLWNVAESGCGGSSVHILNTATASLYNYTPYQPNAAALAAYPGVGDSCSAYGNRNFYYLFVGYFGGTGGGSPVSVNGVSITIPASSSVPAALVGKTVNAPNAAVARGIAAGFAVLGTPYVWGGGTNGGPADNGCARGGGASNSCQGIVGFDCSGLTGYVLAQAGFTIPDNSAGQRSSGTDVPWAQGLPGDIIGYPGHVAIYLGSIDGTAYLLEAPEPGEFVHIKAVYSGGSMTADS